MRKEYMFRALSILLFLFGHLLIAAQAVQVPTVRQVYSFTIGDTFEYSGLTNYLPNNECENQNVSNSFYVIADVQQNGDTIIYKIDTYTLNQFECPPYHYSAPTTDSSFFYLTLTQLDSPVYKSCNFYHSFGSDTGTYSGDTTYINTQVNGLISNAFYFIDSVNVTSQKAVWTVGLGSLSNSYDHLIPNYETQTDVNVTDYFNLIYCSKRDGTRWGTIHTFNWLTAIENVELGKIGAKLYPNPAAGFFKLALSNVAFDGIAFRLYDALGRVVTQLKVTDGITEVSVNNLPAGLYYWQIYDANGLICSDRIVLE